MQRCEKALLARVPCWIGSIEASTEIIRVLVSPRLRVSLPI